MTEHNGVLLALIATALSGAVVGFAAGVLVA